MRHAMRPYTSTPPITDPITDPIPFIYLRPFVGGGFVEGAWSMVVGWCFCCLVGCMYV